MLKPKPNIAHLPIYQPGMQMDKVKRQYGLTDIVKLASNENPFGSSPKAMEAIQKELEHTHLYPDGRAYNLTHKLAEKLHVKPAQIICGAGSDEIILMLVRTYLAAGDETIMSAPTFPQYKHNSEIENAVCIEVPLTPDGRQNLEGMLARITNRTKIVWICNPNNPTGKIVTKTEVESFLRLVPSNVLVVMDEAYNEYCNSADYPDSLSLLNEYPNLVILRTFSKIYGLAAMRIGYAIGHLDVIRTIQQVREPFNTSRFAQAAALASLEDQAFIAQCRRHNLQGLIQLYSGFDRLGLFYYESHANFVLVDVKRPAEEVFQELLAKGIIVRGGHALGFPSCIRVSVGSTEQNDKFLAALERVLQPVERLEQEKRQHTPLYADR